MLDGMDNKSVLFIGGAAALLILVGVLFFALRPQRVITQSGTVSSDSVLAPQTEGVLKGTDSYNLPGTTYPSVTPVAPIRQPATPPAREDVPVACTMEAMMCPDGSYVGRTGPNCAFAQCPGN